MKEKPVSKRPSTETTTKKREPTRETLDVSPTSPHHQLTPKNPLWAIVGMPGAGKSVIVEHLKSKSWNVVHFGAVTMQELEKRFLVVNETNERKIREELRKTYGMEAYARLSIDQIRDDLAKGPTVIDGLYSWSEYKFLRNQLSNRFRVIAVFTPKDIRYERLATRQDRPLSYQEAESRDFAEIENLEKGGPIAMADFTLDNSGSIKSLYSKVDALLNTLLQP